MSKLYGVSYLNLEGSEHTPVEQDSANLSAISMISVTATRDLIEMLNSMFDGIDDSFFELANNARTNNEQNQFFEAMRDLRIKRKNIEAQFEQKVGYLFSSTSVLQPKNNTPEQNQNIGLESLSLVQNDDLEEDVALSSMSNKARSNFQGPLLQFHARITKLYGTQELDKINPPLDPKDISNAFSQACSGLEIDLKERLIVLKLREILQ